MFLGALDAEFHSLAGPIGWGENECLQVLEKGGRNPKMLQKYNDKSTGVVLLYW